MTLLVGALTIGLILSLLAMGVFISFRVFGFPDITADGSVTLGAAVAAVLAVAGVNPWLALGAALLSGMAAGAATGVLHTKFGINGLLSGILVMTALYSVNLHVMGKSNVPLLGNPIQFSPDHLKQPERLSDKLVRGDDPLSAWLLSRLGSDTQRALKELHGGSVSDDLRRALARDLNAVIQGDPLFEEKRFAGVLLSDRSRELIAAAPTGEESVRLNRFLMDEAFPDEISGYRELQTLTRQAESFANWLAGPNASPRLNVWGWELDRRDAALLVASLAFVTAVGVILFLFLKTNLGTAMRATGDNPDMIRALGVNVENMIVFGLAISNGLIAVSGALLAQYQGFADVQLGIGMVIWGLASVIIGEALVGRSGVGLTIVGAVFGSVLFRLLLAIALRWGLNPNDLKLVTSLFVFAALVLPGFLEKLKKKIGLSNVAN